MSDIDPLTEGTEQLQDAVTRSAVASDAGGAATVEVDADGTLRSIRLGERGRVLDPDVLVEMIVRLHGTALADARRGIADAVTRLERDPRLRAERDRMIDALAQPISPRSAAGPSEWADIAPVPPAPRRGPTPEEDEEMDRYYQRKSWLE